MMHLAAILKEFNEMNLQFQGVNITGKLWSYYIENLHLFHNNISKGEFY